MNITAHTTYRTSDGEEFESLDDAKAHQEHLDARARAWGRIANWRLMNGERIALDRIGPFYASKIVKAFFRGRTPNFPLEFDRERTLCLLYLVARHFTEEDLDTLATEVRNESY